jgi:hypothetical protein
MPRIIKDYKNRRRTPINIAHSEPNDQSKMSGNTGSATNAGHSEGMIAHEKGVKDRTSRKILPNAKLGRK